MKELLMNSIKETIKTWNEPDIYAISLFVYDEDDNPCKPTVTLGYNTEAVYESEIENAWDAEEARWNYAFWLQNDEMVFGIDETEAVVKKWILENGLPYSEDAEFEDEEYEAVTKAFVAVLVDIVKDLHASGFIKDTFGKPIPILIHELEYYDEIAEQNIEANGEELVKEFVHFCMAEE